MKIQKYLIPSISDIIFISVFLYLSLSVGNSLLNDGDTGYHIKAGEYILENLSIPEKDIFSYHYPAIPWTAHEWLSEVVMAIIHKISGLTGIVLFFSFLIAFSYYIFFKILKRYKTNILITILLTLLVIASSQIHWLSRPHMFSLLLFIIWYYLLDEFQYRDRNYLLFMPFLMLLWVNLHGGFISGFILLAIYLFGNIGIFLKSKVELVKKRIANLVIILFLCLVAAFINPYGYKILLFPFKLTSNKFIMDNVNEFLSPNFHEPMFFTVLLFLVIGVLAVSKKRLNIIELMLILLFIYMPLYSIRYVPLFAVISAPIISKYIQLLLDESNGKVKLFLDNRSLRISSIDSSAKGLLLPILSVIFVLYLSLLGEIRFNFDKKSKPVDAVEFIKKEKINGNMFNNDEFGDYIIYAAWPQYRVFFDGRSDMYGTEMMKEYFKVTRIQPDIDNVLEKYRIDWIIYDSGSSLSVYLLQKKDWKLIYSDGVADIFVRDIKENQPLIEKYRGVKPFEKDKDKDKVKVKEKEKVKD
jgi:hypothetical protein